MSIAVLGAGIAGTAAAYVLARAGQRPTLFHQQAGASALYSGALDFTPFNQGGPPHEPSLTLTQFAVELGVWALPPTTVHVATPEGNVRSARGADRAILALDACAGQRVAIVDVERDDWDARLLAKSLSASAWAEQTRTEFVPVRVRALQNTFERRISSYDFAALHDSPERVSALLAELRARGDGARAWLFGPWLGLERAVASELSAGLGAAVGETTSIPGGIAGARFERARDLFLAKSAVVERAHVSRVTARATGYLVETDSGEFGEFSAIVIASGGVAAGGIVLDRAFDRPGGIGFRLSFDGPVAVALDGEFPDGVSSLSNFDFVDRGLGVLAAIGIAVDERCAARGAEGLFVAGDALAARPRTALYAAESGIAAASRALNFSGVLA